MRKERAFSLIVVLIILSAGFVMAGSADYADKINKAFNCLDNRVEAASITLEEAVFSQLANTPNPKINSTIAQQKSSSEACWPRSGCTVKSTAQVALAKMRKGENVTDSLNWLKTKTGVTQQMTWYLQISIDSIEQSNCNINYDDKDYSIAIGEDMRLTGAPGSCLSITPSGYWLKIGSNCLNKVYSIQCDKSFRTNLLYEKDSGGTIFVSPDTHGAAAGSWTTEKISAKCFKEGANCNYEGSLWAATALYASGENIEEFGPYLRALASENQRYFPSAFLIAISEGREEHYGMIMTSQRIRPEGAYWQMASSPYGKFYDTSLAMLALGGADSATIDNTRTLNYLFTNQDSNGCWGGGNIRDTAFIIYAAGWLRSEVPVVEPPPQQAICGDGIANNGEACDGNDLRGLECANLTGFVSGVLKCYDNCTYNVSACVASEPPVQQVCGDGAITGSEVCDCGTDGVCMPSELNYQNCTSVGDYIGGVLGCAAGCLEFNVSGCFAAPAGNATNVTNTTGPYNPNLLTNCELAGLFCVPSMFACMDAGGTYFSQNTHVCKNHNEFCCTKPVTLLTCASLGGVVCAFDEPCTTLPKESKDGACCVGGTCESFSGCYSDSDCSSGEVCIQGKCELRVSAQCSDNADCFGGQECKNGKCVDAEKSGSKLWIWIVALLILITLVVLGIVYKDKLRVWWYQRMGKAKSPKVGLPPGAPPGTMMQRRPMPRFGAPPGTRPLVGAGGGRMMIKPRSMGGPTVPPAKPPVPENEKQKEEEETLRKLKEMSK